MTEDASAGDNSWDPSLYDDDHSFVYEYGTELVDLLDPKETESILDVGCGTGQLTSHIGKFCDEIVGVDTAREMLVRARREYPNHRWVQADARQMRFKTRFDAVFSNAALHWISEPEAVLQRVSEALHEEGRFVAEFGGTGNVETIVSEIEEVVIEAGYRPYNPWYFPSIGEYTTLLERHGFEPTDVRLLDRPTPLEGEEGLRNWLTMFTDSFFAEVPPNERASLIEAIEQGLRDELYDPTKDRWVADYRRLRIKARVS